jgi:hypothetical protein
MKSLTFVTFVAVCLLVFLEGFAQPVADGMQTYEEFERKITQYPYHAKPKRMAKIISGIVKLRICMDKQQIQSLLGSPDYSRTLYGPKGPGEKWLGTSWMYFLTQESDLVNTNDSTVEVFFDTKNRAHWIVPQQIKEAREIGSFNAKCF